MSEPRVIRLTLPLPPSVNRFWRSVGVKASKRAKVLISEEGRRFVARSTLIARMQCKAMLDGDVEVSGAVFFANRKRDLDNIIKPTLDVLEGIVYANDRQVARMTWEKRLDAKNPRIELEIREATP